MDRWGYLDKWKEYERKRARLIPGWVEAYILAAVVASLLGGRLLHCALEVEALGTCIAAGMPRVLAMSLHSGALLFGIWAGPRVGLRLESESPRVLRRLQPLRGWSHEEVSQVFTRGPGAGRADGW